MEKSSYFLSSHTFFCLADGHYVFLDLRSDEYLCLGRTHTDAIEGLLNGHQTATELLAGIRLRDSRDSDQDAVMRALLRKELLVEDAAEGKPVTPALVDAPMASVAENSDKPRPGIGLAHVWNFFAASATASKNVRWGSIERTVREVEARKSTHIAAATVADDDVITNLFEIFRTLRPYYPRPYLCMFDSLALLHFLARYGVFPQWVYGVKLEPFGAHCWVQAGDLVVNDIVDNVRGYTPIMSV